MLKNNVCQQGLHGLAAKTRSWNCFSTRVEQTREIRIFIALWTGYKLKITYFSARLSPYSEESSTGVMICTCYVFCTCDGYLIGCFARAIVVS